MAASLIRISSEYLLGLDGEAKGYFARAGENLQDMVAEQATELALGP
jgi:hypothetical protein